MKGVILAGGRGSRLMPLTKNMPKPLVPILDKPVMWYIIRLMRRAGIRDIAVTLGYLGEQIRGRFGDGSDLGVRLHYVCEDAPLGTAGGVKNAQAYLDEDFVVVSGDAYTDFDLSALVDFHYRHWGMMTLAAYNVPDPSHFGVILSRADGLITSFQEKPVHPLSHLVNTGIYVADRRVLSLIPLANYDFARDLFPRLLGNLYACECNGMWSDIGTLPSYYMTNYQIVQNKVAADMI